LKYPYADLNEDQFEAFILAICKKLLGTGAQKYTKGKDAGIDIYFNGTTEKFPSSASPWSGSIISQAKHTSSWEGTFSDSDFSGVTKSSDISKEIPKIRRLFLNGVLTHYIIFSNRRLSGTADINIRKRIENETGVPFENIRLFGIDDLDGFSNSFPGTMNEAGFSFFDYPLSIEPSTLANLFEAFLEQVSVLIADKDNTKEIPTRIPFKEKNIINNFSSQAASFYRRNYLHELGRVEAFLQAPENIHYAAQYYDIVDDLNMKYETFACSSTKYERFIDGVYNQLLDRDPIFRGNRRLTRVILFYMYWTCDLGRLE
jgi:hypothetical protein